MNKQTTEDLAQRLARLEKQNRRLQWWVILFFVVFGAGLLMGQARPGGAKKTMEAEEFILSDTEGRIRARLGLLQRDSKEGPAMEFYDKEGDAAVELGLMEGDWSAWSGLVVRDENDKRQVQVGRWWGGLGGYWTDDAGLWAYSKWGSLEIGRFNTLPMLMVNDRDGKVRVQLTLRGHDPQFAFYDKHGQRVFSAP